MNSVIGTLPKKFKASNNTDKTMPAVVKMAMQAQDNNKISMILSYCLRELDCGFNHWKANHPASNDKEIIKTVLMVVDCCCNAL